MSAAERVVQRGASAAVTLLLAVVADPGAVGWYSLGMLALTFFQAAADGAVRQVGGAVWRAPDGAAFLRRAAVLIGVTGVLWMSAICVAVGFAAGSIPRGVSIAPLAVVPLASAWALPRVVAAQQTRRWSVIGSSQTAAAVVSLVLSLPLLVPAGALAASMQSMVAEAVFGALIRSRIPAGADVGSRATISLARRHYLPVASANLVAWGQSQGERLIVAVSAGASRLGTYAFAANLTRTMSDAVATGFVNHLRTELAQADSLHDKLSEFRRTVLLAVPTSLALQLVTTVIALWVGPVVLPDSWDPALAAVPVLAAGILPSTITACTTAVFIDARRTRVLVLLQAIGLGLALIVGVAVAASLSAGAHVAVAREELLCAARLTAMRSTLDRATTCVIGGGAGTAVLIALLASSMHG